MERRPMKSLVLILTLAATMGIADRAAARNEIVIPHPDAHSFSRFGHGVALDSEWSVIGAPHHDSEGAAYVRSMADPASSPIELVRPAPASGDLFGNSVAIADDRILVGSPQSGNSGYGRVHVFLRLDETWTHAGTLEGSDHDDDEFGLDVALDGDRALILSDEAAYVYTWCGIGCGFALDQVLTPGFPLASGDLHDDVIALGAHESADSAAVEAYRFDGSQWQHEQTLTPTPVDSDSAFGTSVAVSDDWIAVGDPRVFGPYPLAEQPGSVTLFGYEGAWTLHSKLQSGGTLSFGIAVDVAGNGLAIGDSLHDLRGAPGAGTVHRYVYSVATDTWMPRPSLVAGDHEPFDEFGRAVAATPSRILVGAPSRDDGVFLAVGRAYLYDLPRDFAPLRERFLLVAKILVGVIEGGGGILVLPGETPIPVPPDPYVPADPTLPVAVHIYMGVDPEPFRERARRAIGGSRLLAANGLGGSAEPVATTAVEDLLARPHSILQVIAGNDPRAVDWIVENADAIRFGRTEPAILYVEGASEAHDALRTAIARGGWK